MSALIPSPLDGFMADDGGAHADVDLLCEILNAGSDVRLDVDGHLLLLPPEVRDVLGRVVEHLRRGDDIRRSLQGIPATVMLQPVVALKSGVVVGYEALSDLPSRGLPATEHWFRDGARYGLAHEFELGAVGLALAQLEDVPSAAYLAVNVSPATVIAGALEEMLAGVDAARLVLEITEHAPVEDYAALDLALARLRRTGARIAVDDAGAGFSSLQHILRVQPEIVKLDISMIRDIEVDPARRALVTALVHFTAELGAESVAEGVETRAQAEVLTDLGVGHGQGWYFGVPARLEGDVA